MGLTNALSIPIFPTGIQPAYPQNCFALLAPLPSFTSSQPCILALSLMHRQPAFPNRPSVTWSSQTPLNWWCAHSPASCHRAVCKRCSRCLCCQTKPRSASKLGRIYLPIYLPIYLSTYMCVYIYICLSDNIGVSTGSQHAGDLSTGGEPP